MQADGTNSGLGEETKAMVGLVNQAVEGALGGSESLLNFRVFHCSSQDASHTVSELTPSARDPNNLVGWHSQRFCVYPQELILVFDGGVHITQIKLLIHETKIP